MTEPLTWDDGSLRKTFDKATEPHWKERFKDTFGLFSNYADFCPSTETYINFIEQVETAAYSRGKADMLEEVREIVVKAYCEGILDGRDYGSKGWKITEIKSEKMKTITLVNLLSTLEGLKK